MTYSADFYEIIRAGCRRSAAAVVPTVYELVKPRRVVDVGCGEGLWGREFVERGCEVLGVDGDYVQDPLIPFRAVDLEQPFYSSDYVADLAVCLEVAEHLSPERAESFVTDLCRLAPVVLFSAAIPCQGGNDHRNERWASYWVRLFECNDFHVSGDLRWRFWNDDQIEPWYRQNLLVASHNPLPGLHYGPVPDVIHPTYWCRDHNLTWDVQT